MEHTIGEISEELVLLLQEKFGVASASLEPSNRNAPLTGSVFKLSGVDLVYLFFEVEKHFDLEIDRKMLMSYGFSSIDKIAQVIEKTYKLIKVSASDPIVDN